MDWPAYVMNGTIYRPPEGEAVRAHTREPITSFTDPTPQLREIEKLKSEQADAVADQQRREHHALEHPALLLRGEGGADGLAVKEAVHVSRQLLGGPPCGQLAPVSDHGQRDEGLLRADLR